MESKMVHGVRRMMGNQVGSQIDSIRVTFLLMGERVENTLEK